MCATEILLFSCIIACDTIRRLISILLTFHFFIELIQLPIQEFQKLKSDWIIHELSVCCVHQLKTLQICHCTYKKNCQFWNREKVKSTSITPVKTRQVLDRIK